MLKTELLWSDGDFRIVLYLEGGPATKGRIAVEDTETGWTDWPVVYPHSPGYYIPIAYDNPYRIPLHVQSKVRELFQLREHAIYDI